MNIELRDRLFTAVPALISLLKRNHQQAIELKLIVDGNADLVANVANRSDSLEANVQLLTNELATCQSALIVAMNNERASAEAVVAQSAQNQELSLKIARMNEIDQEQILAIQAAQLSAGESTAKLAAMARESDVDDAKIKDLLDTAQASIDDNSPS